MGERSFVVVGAGFGGVAAALRLGELGHRVVVLEKTGQVGGRNRSVTVGACGFDAGPTLVMMLDPFKKLFRDVGERIEDHLELGLCDPGYRVFFSGGERIDATPNMARMMQAIESLAGREEALAYPRLIGDLAKLYATAIPRFVERNFYSAASMYGKGLSLADKASMLGNFSSRIAGYFKDPRLRMLFSFQTLYLGLSPLDAPWVYGTLTYMEYGEGIWYPKSGVAEISRAIARLAEARGVEIRLDSPVAKIEGSSVVLESGERIEGDAVICNADLPYAYRELIADSPKRSEKWRYSCSSFMLYLDYEGALPELLHHNVFFGSDFEGNLEAIFRRGELPEDPAFYACVSCRSDAAKAPAGHENLYVLVPCPNLDRPWTPSDAEYLTEKVFARLAREVGFDRARVRASSVFTPEDWAGELNLERGAAFGLSHDLMQSAYFRPANRSKGNPKLYFVGASTVPGNGLPMVLISADLVVQRLGHDGVL